MNSFTIKFPDNSIMELENGVRPITILHKFQEDNRHIIAVKVNNELTSLEKEIDISCSIEPVFLDSKEGIAIYRRSLCFLLACAASKLFPKTRLLVGHSLGHGYYYTLETEKEISEEQVSLLKKEMMDLVNNDKIISTKIVSYQEACVLFEESGQTETRKQLNYRCPSKIMLNTLESFYDLYFEPLASTTGILKVFDLMKYKEGFLLRFPNSNDVSKLTEFRDEPKLYEVYKKYKQWGKQVDLTSVASLNQIIHDRKTTDLIIKAETSQRICISDIARDIAKRKDVKVALIAGPSSSGKTTTSKKLSLYLSAMGLNPKVIGLDDYFVDRTRTPKDADGNFDYECLEALDVELLNQNLLDLFAGKEVMLPSYDFHKGESYFKGNKMHLEENDILVMEGIHGLNPKLTPLIPDEKKYKIYLSALTQLNLDDHNRISTSDNRLIRRIVRDSQFRGKSAADTIAMWDSVQKGERLHIFPFQNNADAILNTALDYEISVLKIYADPLLRCVTPLQKEYSEANRLLNFLSFFSQIPATAVPNDSIIREFIGGSSFKY